MLLISLFSLALTALPSVAQDAVPTAAATPLVITINAPATLDLNVNTSTTIVVTATDGSNPLPVLFTWTPLTLGSVEEGDDDDEFVLRAGGSTGQWKIEWTSTDGVSFGKAETIVTNY